ncbi:metallophosphoesterase [Planococcus koreensis]|uniref:metallophosphoesterase n=1 Tax=Planococcus koreensis TaxID=112331 RepID=UPI0039FC2FA2
MKLKIIHTNDVHSNYDNFARAATLIKLLKDENTLVLDGGDFADFRASSCRAPGASPHSNCSSQSAMTP